VNKLNLGSVFSFFLFIAFSLGIIAAYFLSSFTVFFVLVLLCLFFVYFTYRKNCIVLSDIWILILFFSLGGVWNVSFSAQKSLIALNKEVEVVLQVLSIPQENKRNNTFFAEIRTINAQKSSLKLKVRVIDYTRSLAYLDIYKVKGKITQRVYHNRDFYYFWIKSKVQPLKFTSGVWTGISQKVVNYILTTYKTNCSDQAYRFLGAVFLGRRELIKDEKGYFSDAGVSHLLAISGLHVGITSLLIFFILKFFSLNFRICLFVSLIFLFAYTFLTGATPSTIRAVIMYSVFAIGFFLQTKVNPLNSLGISGLIILLCDPSDILKIGFQLSFVSVFAIIVGYRILNFRFTRNIILNYLEQIIVCSFLVTLLILPLVSYYFHKVYILSAGYNLLLIPSFTLILIVNFLLLIFSPVIFIAQSLGCLLSIVIDWFINLVRILGSLKLSLVVYTFSFKQVVVYYLFLALAVAGYCFRKKRLVMNKH